MIMKKVDFKNRKVALRGAVTTAVKVIALVAVFTVSPAMKMGAQDNTDTAKAFLEKLKDATPVTEEENKVGLYIESVTPSEGDYIVNYACKNQTLWGQDGSRAFLMTQIYFIDPENYTNNYQPFTRNEDGTVKLNFKQGDEIGYPVRRIGFEPPSKVMYMYFVGVEKGNNNPPEFYTVPLFFTIVLGDTPYVLEKTPRHANNLFVSAIKK
jgi:hypothetical protein